MQALPIRRLLLPMIAGWLTIGAIPLHACQICLPIPTSSAADHLIEAAIVVLAREDPNTPFSLVPVEVLKGDPTGKPIDLFLDSRSRRTLSLNPDRKIICVYFPRGSSTGWKRIGTTDQTVEPLVREILERSLAWKEVPEDRSKYFAKLLGHENPQVSTVAHLEVARAPYNEIKQFGGILPVEDLRAFLQNFRLMEWHALYILLLAQSEDEQDHRLIEERVRSAEKFSTSLQLAAWATAWIEIEEERALEFFEIRYLENPERGPDEVRAVLAAFSVHGNKGHTHLRDRIVEGYRLALGQHPVMAPQMVSDLKVWEKWDLASLIESIINAPPETLDLAGLLPLRSYLNQAREVSEEREKDDQERAPDDPLLILLGLIVLVLIPVGMTLLNRGRKIRRRTMDQTSTRGA